jgi:hypothetical protein
MLRKALLAAVATLALAGTATAKERDSKILRIMMPDGSVQQVRYTGDVPPTLVVVPVRRIAMPVSPIDADFMAPFAMLDRISAEMDRRMEAMLRQASSLAASAGNAPSGAAGPSGLTLAADGVGAPAGSVSYSFVSSSSAGGTTCSRFVQMVSQGPGKEPQVTERTEGDCGAAKPDGAAPAAAAPAAPKIDARDTI